MACSTAHQLLRQLQTWQSAQQPIIPLDDDTATERLEKAGIHQSEREEKLNRLTLGGKTAPPRVLANYADLHGLDRIDEATHGIDLTNQPCAANIRAVMQAAEIALLNINDLSVNITQDINAGRIGQAEEKYRWISSFQQTLHSLSLLESSFPVTRQGTHISIADSASAGAVLENLTHVHRAMDHAGLTSPDAISSGNLYEAGRNLTHQAFVDTTYTSLWMNSLKAVPIPDVVRQPYEDDRAFYKRFVGTDALELAVNELNQEGDNFFRQFRAYHQMSEILVKQANLLIANAVTTILTPGSNLIEATENMATALSMLEIMNQNIVPILRNLSANQYQDIRGSLGITSGSHSSNIKQGLFKPLYDLFIEAVMARVMELKPYSENALNARLQEIVQEPTKDHQTHDMYTLLKQSRELYTSVSTWKDLHMQYVKTQIGLSPEHMKAMASISGAPNAARSAHNMNRAAHGENDVIIPVYQALAGKQFSSVPPFDNVFRSEGQDNFVDTMLVNTARVVAERSASVQRRIHVN